MMTDTTDATGSAAHFASTRAHFHRMVELDARARDAALQQLALEDSGLAAAVGALLGRFDAADLVPPPPTSVPERLGPYRVLALLGRGGMGEVYVGERADGAYEHRVALKLIRSGHGGLGLDARFLRERQILARLDHPHIARLIDGGSTESGQPWLAMEFVDGVDLATWVTQTRADLKRRIRLFVRICDAVAFAHRALIVHRDLKPANVLVGAGDEPRLLDFGIAKLIDDDSDAPTRTLFAGLTLRYAAPEQVLGDRTTTATDVYALGVVLYELIAQRSPYRAADSDQLSWRDAILRGETCALAENLADALLDGIDAERAARELAVVVRKAMALSPVDRYNGVAALADDLRDWLDGRPFRSGIGSVSARLRMQLMRWRWPLLSAAAVAAALTIGAVLALQQAWRAREQAAVAEANMQGMLDVLGELEVIDYTEPDPPLSKALVAAGARLQREYADRPDYLWRALGAIGRTLYNRHRADLAAPLLRATEAALARDPAATPAQRFDFAVMHYTAVAPTDASEIEVQAARITALAAAVPVDKRLAEIVNSAHGLSLYGKHAAALALVRTVAITPAALVDASPTVRDDYFVRRGAIEWHAGEIEAAHASHERVDAAAAATAAAHAVPVLLMRSELALHDGDLAAAIAAIALARQRAAGQTLHPGDRERVHIAAARVALARDDAAGAQSELDAAFAAFAALHGARHVRSDLRSALWLQAGVHALRAQCAEAAGKMAEANALLGAASAGSPAVQAEARSARGRVAAHCPGASGV